MADAAANLASFPAPPGARRVAQVPATASEWLKQAPLTTGQIDDVSYWTVAGAPVNVLTWVREHLPRQYTLIYSGTEGGLYMTPYRVRIQPQSSTGTSSATSIVSPRAWYDEFTLRTTANALPVRALIVTVASAGTGQTAIRVDAQDSWARTRSATQLVPDSVTSVTVSPDRAGGPIIVGGSTTVTSPALVRRIVSLVNELPLYATNVSRSCSVPVLEGDRLVFRDGTGRVVASATASLYQCGTVSLTIDSHPAVVLGGATQLVRELEPYMKTSTGAVNPGGPVVMAP